MSAAPGPFPVWSTEAGLLELPMLLAWLRLCVAGPALAPEVTEIKLLQADAASSTSVCGRDRAEPMGREVLGSDGASSVTRLSAPEARLGLRSQLSVRPCADRACQEPVDARDGLPMLEPPPELRCVETRGPPRVARGP